MMIPSVSRSSAFNHCWQESWSCWPNANDWPTYSRVSAWKCWQCCSEMWPTRCRMAHFRSTYLSLFWVGSCWVVSWTFLVRSGKRQAARCLTGHHHTYMTCLRSTWKAFRSPWGPIFVRVAWRKPADTVGGMPTEASRFQNAWQYSCWACSKALKRYSCSLCKVTSAWFWFCWEAARTWMSFLKGKDSMSAVPFSIPKFRHQCESP